MILPCSLGFWFFLLARKLNGYFPLVLLYRLLVYLFSHCFPVFIHCFTTFYSVLRFVLTVFICYCSHLAVSYHQCDV